MGGLVVVNPMGLEDWKAKGVPIVTVDELYARELKTSADGIKKYQLTTYYGGQWKPEYDRWVSMLAGMYKGDGGKRVAWNQALTSDMIFAQPVVYELPRIAMPTLLLIGLKDNTAIGKDRAPPDVAKTLGNYAELASQTKERIPHRDAGHVSGTRAFTAGAGPRALQQDLAGTAEEARSGLRWFASLEQHAAYQHRHRAQHENAGEPESGEPQKARTEPATTAAAVGHQ